MKGSKIFAVSCALVAYAAAQECAQLSWSPTDGGQVSTGGYWYTYSDVKNDGGNSSTVPAEPETPAGETPDFDWIGEHITNACDGTSLCATLTLGDAIQYPFAGVAFDYLSPKVACGVGETTTLCVALSTDKKIRIAMNTADAADLGWDTFGWDFSSTGGNCTVFQKAYSTAKQEGWGTKGINSFQYESLQFAYKNAVGSTANVKIYQVSHGACSCTPGTGSPVLPKAQMAGIKANLNGSVLAFSGLGKRAVAVEVLNLQGRVVAAQTVSAAANVLDLSKLSQGVYLVKAASKDVRFNQMITLQ